MKSLTVPSVIKDVEQMELAYIPVETVKRDGQFRNQFGRFL